MTKVKALWAKTAHARKALVAGLAAGLGVIATAGAVDKIDWGAVVMAAVLALAGGGATYQTRNTPKQ